MPRFGRLPLSLCFAVGLACAQATEVVQTTSDVDTAAIRLFERARYDEAGRMLGDWLVAHPNDAQILFRHAYGLTLQASIATKPEAAKALRRDAFAEAQRAQKLGCRDPLLPTVLSSIDADGRDLTDPKVYSNNPAAATLVQKGEQAFTRRDLETAITCYQQALELDPRSYTAALYLGDVYFSQNRCDEAIEWFGRAVAINPEREVAYRYLGDAHAKLGHLTDAREAYIAAVIADPYQKTPRDMLTRFTQLSGGLLRRPMVSIPSVKVGLNDGKVAMECDPSRGPLLLAYATGRAQWLTDERPKYFAPSTAVRHSLQEECAGLRLFVAAADEVPDPKVIAKLGPTIRTVKAIDQAGLLEAYVLLDRADKEIAQDYAMYRRLHRDRLERYIHEIWLGHEAPAPAATFAGK